MGIITLSLSIFNTCLYSIVYILHILAYTVVKKTKYEYPLTLLKHFLFVYYYYFIFITIPRLIFYSTSKEKGVGYVTMDWEKWNTRIIS